VVQDIRDAQSVEQILATLNARISGLTRKKPVAPPSYWGTAASPFNGAGPTTPLAVSTNYTVSSVAIPDPGYPYRIDVSACLLLQGLSTSQAAGASHSVSVRVDSTTPLGPADDPTSTPSSIGAEFIGQMGGVAGAFATARIRRCGQTVWTGAHTVNFMVKMGTAGGATVAIPLTTRSDFHFEVRVVPATT
jgi:hypothetical protein